VAGIAHNLIISRFGWRIRVWLGRAAVPDHIKRRFNWGTINKGEPVRGIGRNFQTLLVGRVPFPIENGGGTTEAGQAPLYNLRILIARAG
jgi:hypothetical protein